MFIVLRPFPERGCTAGRRTRSPNGQMRDRRVMRQRARGSRRGVPPGKQTPPRALLDEATRTVPTRAASNAIIDAKKTGQNRASRGGGPGHRTFITSIGSCTVFSPSGEGIKIDAYLRRSKKQQQQHLRQRELIAARWARTARRVKKTKESEKEKARLITRRSSTLSAHACRRRAYPSLCFSASLGLSNRKAPPSR